MNNSPILDIESLDMEARGVGHLPNEDGTPGKVIFVEGALPGERVRFKSYRRKPKWEAADMTELLRESSLRVKPKCEFFGICGGCAMTLGRPVVFVGTPREVARNAFHLHEDAQHSVLQKDKSWYAIQLRLTFIN